jgi:hypothetical protein
MAQVKALSLGGLGSPCCCSGGGSICVVACPSNIPVYGATVTVQSGGSGGPVVFTGTTPASGCVSPGVSGTFFVTVTISGVTCTALNRTLGGSVVISITTCAGLICCGGYMIPTSLTLTDAAGSFAFDYNPGSSPPIWYGGHSVTQSSATVTGGGCVVNPATSGPVRVCYQMLCLAGSTPVFYAQRSWSWVYISGTLTPIWYQDSTGFVAGQPCATAPPAACGSPHTDSASFSANPSSTTPFTLSGTPVASGGNFTTDPVGGSVVISA